MDIHVLCINQVSELMFVSIAFTEMSVMFSDIDLHFFELLWEPFSIFPKSCTEIIEDHNAQREGLGKQEFAFLTDNYVVLKFQSFHKFSQMLIYTNVHINKSRYANMKIYTNIDITTIDIHKC